MQVSSLIKSHLHADKHHMFNTLPLSLGDILAMTSASVHVLIIGLARNGHAPGVVVNNSLWERSFKEMAREAEVTMVSSESRKFWRIYPSS